MILPFEIIGPNAMKPQSQLKMAKPGLVWRVVDVLSSAVIVLTIGVACAVFLQAGDIMV
jgi:hypothetical protein